MGLDGFLSYVKKKHQGIVRTEHISLYSHQTVFFDISSYIYKYVCIFGTHDGRWLTAMLQLFLTFRENKINIIPIFDGKPPDAKKDETDMRKEQRNKIKNKAETLEEGINLMKEGKTPEEETMTLIKDCLKTLKEKNETTKLKSLMKFANEQSNESENITEEDLTELEIYVSSLRRQMVYIRDSDYGDLRDMLNILGIPFKTAPNEAETYCCAMIRQGIGSAVISCDSDCFAHLAKDVILSVDTSGMIEHLTLQDILDALEIDEEQMTDLAFLFGCDYNAKNKLYKVGPVKALELIKKYGRLENIEGYDKEKINSFIELRKLFRIDYPAMKKYANKDIDEEALLNFVEDKRIRVGRNKIEEVVKKINKKVELVFADDEE
jgi:5'-3' exonuclease